MNPSLTIARLKEKNLLLLESISGSRAYGLATPQSDTDIKGVFVLPKTQLYSLQLTEQINNETNDESYYELGKFIDLLTKNNPNILELLNSPEDCILFRHPLLKRLSPSLFLSGLCRQTFGQYAMTQIRKARGLNKKILNPMEKERKSVTDFCYVQKGQSSVALKDFLHEKQIDQKHCGLSKIPHMQDLYGLYYDKSAGYKGIIRKENANDIALSSINKIATPIALLSFNKDGYSTYCKNYKAYWDWVEDRNETRYENTLSHGKQYDAKNMMHTFRLIAMAEEIGLTGKIKVKRPDRDRLLSIKRGEFEYADLVAEAEERLALLDEIYRRSDLPDQPDEQKIRELHFEIREAFYEEK